MSEADLALLARVAVGFALAYLFGFERQLRGSPAGDRTFALVGASAAAITAVASGTSPQAVAGVVTGIGFLGAGVVVFQRQRGVIKGITTAATIFASAAIGVVVGYGHLLLGAITAAGLLLTLELEHIPFLRWLDARTYSARFQSDETPGESSRPDSSER
ncbi:MAG TPA: MgtC/SapB family protein [Acidimicrobiales bacterium]|nr:MgtC/SapB family protein [Acidimicrobiales bacterium]